MTEADCYLCHSLISMCWSDWGENIDSDSIKDTVLGLIMLISCWYSKRHENRIDASQSILNASLSTYRIRANG